MKNRNIIIAVFILAILFIDQLSKFWIKTSMTLGESIRVFDWFYILFVENNGMAFGMTIGSKLFLTTFRLLLIGVLIYYVAKLVRQQYKLSFLLCLSLILAGAIGNVIDCLFYGLIFSESTFFDVATL
ncbi:MAG: signal peptidase II, partial [Paludibacteraceae bacterium]|nr:signal peptidase II [Paludibacteraceae bacterium]